MIRPKPRTAPKLKRLPDRKRMTIAIGLLTTEGLVIAADRQETVGVQKLNQGKITGHWKREPWGSVAVSGSGDAFNLDVAMAKVREWFSQSKTASLKEIEKGVETVNADFYREKVDAVSGGDKQTLDYALLVGCALKNDWPTLWTTHQMGIRKEEEFAAVGAGEATAKNLLQTYYTRLPMAMAISLAAFVIHEVKTTVDFCGLETDILCCWRFGAIEYVDSDEIREMEAAFKLLKASEYHLLHDCLGSDLTTDYRYKSKKYETKKVKAIFRRLNKKRAEQFERRMLPVVPVTAGTG
jgi:20S proteasome alpha/beta subunit